MEGNIPERVQIQPGQQTIVELQRHKAVGLFLRVA
jgi:hypothetical protein